MNDELEVIRVPRVFLSMMDETRTGNDNLVRPIYFSKDGEDGKGEIIGLVQGLTPEGYETLCNACEAYNDKRNAEA